MPRRAAARCAGASRGAVIRINEHLADDMSLPALARQAGMSERSFSRHHAKATGLTPGVLSTG